MRYLAMHGILSFYGGGYGIFSILVKLWYSIAAGLRQLGQDYTVSVALYQYGPASHGHICTHVATIAVPVLYTCICIHMCTACSAVQYGDYQHSLIDVGLGLRHFSVNQVIFL